MTTRRILHAADIHLDSPLKKLDRYESAPSERIRRASRRALENMADLAIEQDVDLVVIAGDLYDGDWTDQNTGLAFVSQAARLTGATIPLLVIRGNHDAANVMTASLPLPKNPDGSEMFLGSKGPESRVFESIGVVVHGQSFRSRAETKNLAARYPAPASGLFNLGLLHTGLEGSASHAHYAPCTAQELTDKGYDYWALGHIHTRADHGIEGGAPIVFSGNIQGRHVGELGAKGCVLFEVDDRNRCEHTFHELDVLRYLECSIDVGEMTDRNEIYDVYQDWLKESTNSCGDRLVVPRVTLTGQSELHHWLHRYHDHMQADLQSITVATAADQGWFESVKIRTGLPETGGHSVDRGRPMDGETLDGGPMESLHAVIRSLTNDPALGEIVQKELMGLDKKLPRELRSESDATFRFDDPQWVTSLIDSAAAEVIGGMMSDGNANQDMGGRS